MNRLRKSMKELLCSLLIMGLAGTSFAAKKLPAKAGLELSPLISDGMVLQRDMEGKLWGKAPADTLITLSLTGETSITTTGQDGHWSITYPAHNAGGPYELSISANNGETKTIKEVLFGDVWICSGQSNMEMPVDDRWGHIKNFAEETAAAHYPLLRLITVDKSLNRSPQDTFKSDGWLPATPESVAKFSAVGYFFGRNLHQDLNIPIGLINTSWSGSIIESWISFEKLSQFPEFEKEIASLDTAPGYLDRMRAAYAKNKALWETQRESKDIGKTGKEFTWSKPDYSDQDWKTMSLPQPWEEAGMETFDGCVWYRKTIDIPKSFAGKKATLNLGTIDDRDITFINGVKVGEETLWNKPRSYSIPGKLLKAGKNVIAVRVMDFGGLGGFSNASTPIELISSIKKAPPISLNGEWKYQVSFNLKEIAAPPAEPSDYRLKGAMYNAMIHPLLPYRIKGAIWYQGESNAGYAYSYREYLPAMIEDWRTRWNQGDFPFLFIQLPDYYGSINRPEPDNWAELRESQLMSLATPSTAMAVIIDTGEPYNLHPTNKQLAGNRLALAARGMVYGEKLEYSGPLYHSCKYEEGGKVRIFFTHTGKGLVAQDTSPDGLREFAIAGADGKFVSAKAAIDGNSVRVWSDNVPEPVAVRYGWHNSPIVNLYNADGLPASPFRTDTWADRAVLKNIK